ncbi:DUF4913 domain-containing protein [Streptomyces anulatus]|uniref:DUF4913 domain-containing protein n=1 Tax=Streptomyces anulatus TaxID=1892 RepID=UPI0033CB950D
MGTKVTVPAPSSRPSPSPASTPSGSPGRNSPTPPPADHTGPSVWHRDQYDPCIRELRTPGGPFNGCTKGEHHTDHRQPGLVPSAWSHA